MSTIHRTSRSGGANALSSSSSPSASGSQLSAPSPPEITNQTTEPHEKRDQVLEASDPDLNPASSSVAVSPTSSPAVVEQLDDAVGTPINIDIEEQDPVESNVDTGDDEDDEQEDDIDQDVSVEIPEEEDEEQSLRLETGAPSHATASAANGGSVEGHRYSGNPVATIKHAKRSADDHTTDSNTVQDDEAQDYLTGVYKSPFRHTHKAEKAGKEER